MAKNNQFAIMPTESLSVFNDPNIGDQFSSFSPDSMEGKIKLYNAINSPDGRLNDFINTPIKIKDVVVSRVKLSEKINSNGGFVEEDSGKREGFRTILIDVDGKSYTATSTGIYNSVATMRAIFGTLHFEDGLTVVVKQIQAKNGKTLTLALT